MSPRSPVPFDRWPSLPKLPAEFNHNARLRKIEKSIYKAEQHAKLLHLQAEVESLWQQVRARKRAAPSHSNSDGAEGNIAARDG
ncbi:MAG: hypothetical protein BRC58_08470 [Cyanobacteria bacterium QS_8_64_29]|nr:MAG: hypothetical protein BRC58_08470 [Cyanobacteria bacterium QS_8_64_29]